MEMSREMLNACQDVYSVRSQLLKVSLAMECDNNIMQSVFAPPQLATTLALYPGKVGSELRIE